MRDEDVLEPRVVPRWMEAGVSGLARRREWDAVVAVELPELAGSPASELSLQVLDDGTVLGGEDVPASALEAIAAELAGSLAPPYEAFATRRGRLDWTVAARHVRLETVSLPETLDVREVTLAVGPDGRRTLLVDGEEPPVPSALLQSVARELERRGRARHAAFAARAERLGPGRWALTVDPL